MATINGTSGNDSYDHYGSDALIAFGSIAILNELQTRYILMQLRKIKSLVMGEELK